MGDSEPIHLIRATAYGREGMLQKATTEYRAALRFAPAMARFTWGWGMRFSPSASITTPSMSC